jgi:predicted transcriptional regulator
MHGKTLELGANTPEEMTVTVLKVLGSLPRWRILQYLAAGDGGRTVNDIAQALNMPLSTAAAQIKILEDADLVHTELRAASHGLQKICTRTYDNVVVELPYTPDPSSNIVEIAMPIGAYTQAEVTPTCGLATEDSLIGYLDDPISFYEPDHIRAGLLWFRSGYVEYNFPKRLPVGARLISLQLSMEICSEAPLHDNNWPSDITLWINGQEVGSWTSPGDFGGQRGRLTPAWWDAKDTQFGLLKRWLLNEEGAFIDGYPLSSLTISGLGLDEQRVITVRIGVKSDALHMGGINLFGHTFGNYPQDLALRLEYLHARRPGTDASQPNMTSGDGKEVSHSLASFGP